MSVGPGPLYVGVIALGSNVGAGVAALNCEPIAIQVIDSSVILESCDGSTVVTSSSAGMPPSAAPARTSTKPLTTSSL